MASYYLWFKGIHVAFMVTWFAGLFYLPRLFIYHVQAEDTVSRERFTVMERRLFAIMTIGAVLTWVFGLVMAALNPPVGTRSLVPYQVFTRNRPGRLPRALLAVDPTPRSHRRDSGFEVVAMVQRNTGGIPVRDYSSRDSEACFLARARSLSNTAFQRLGHQRGRGGNPSGEHARPQLVESARIDAAFEVDHLTHRPPEVDPTHTIEFRFIAAVETHCLVVRFAGAARTSAASGRYTAACCSCRTNLSGSLYRSQSSVTDSTSTSSSESPTSSYNSRYIAASGDSPSSMPPCGNCQPLAPTRPPRSSLSSALTRMMPTLAR